MIKLDIRRVVVTNSRSSGKYVRLSSNGQIAVSADAVRDLEIDDTDKAVFFQDRNNRKDWYFSFGKEGDYVLKGYKKSDDARGFSNAGLRDEILHSLNLPKKTYRLWLSKDPVELEGKKLWKLNLRE